MGLFLRLVGSAVALWLASELVDGVELTARTTQERALTLLGVAVVFALVNAAIKPVVLVVAFPLYLLTLGLLTFVVNGLLLWLTGWVSARLGLAFDVTGFWAGVLGGIVVSVVMFGIGLVLGERRRPRR